MPYMQKKTWRRKDMVRGKKKRWALLLALAMTMQLVGCGNGDSPAGVEGGSPESAADAGRPETTQQSENLTESAEESKESEEAENTDASAEDYPIDWKDDSFKQYMQALTGIRDRDIMYSDIQDITRLDIWLEGFGDYSAVANFTNLKMLSMSGFDNKLNLEVLDSLENLEELALIGIDASAVDSISTIHLPNLSTLKLEGEGIAKLDMLPFDMPMLKSLELGLYDLEDLGGLSAFSGLETLKLNSNVSNVDDLSSLTALTELDLSNCHNITNIDGLSGLSNLISLNLSWCDGITSLDALTGLSNLAVLDLSYCNGIESLEVLAGLPGLETLKTSMGENGSISTLSSLQNVKALDLDLGWNDRVDYSVLADMTNLSSLKLKSEYGGLNFEILSNLGLTSLDLTQYNSSVELGQLASIFPGLITLKIRAYEIKQDVSALSALTNLKELEVWCVDDFDFESLAGLTGLETFALMNYQNYMEESLELSPLEALPNLTALDLTGSQLPVDTSQLSGLTNLKMLKLRACGITDISGLSGLTNLETLDLSVNNFTDVSSLSGLTNLTTLNLKGNEIADYSPVSFVPEVLIGWDDYVG